MPAKTIVREPKNRKCKYPGCKRLLSVYNHNAYCHADLSKMFKSADSEKQEHPLWSH